MERESLRNKFETEENIHWVNVDGEPEIDYVLWLENKLIEKVKSIQPLLCDGFDIEDALNQKGNCKNQMTRCEDCKMGKFIFEHGMKTRIDDLCNSEIVYLLAEVVKTFV